MSRITKYEPSPNSKFPYKLKDDSLATELDCIHKLGTLEDIEDEIDFPLDIAFRALKEGIYREEYGKLEKFDVRGIELDGLGTISNICPYGDCDFTTYYKDYKKSWWLREDKSE